MNTVVHFFISGSSFPFRMRNVSDKFVEKIKTHILCSMNILSKNRALGGMVWKNTVQPDRPHKTI
jgi:hypothetical protein